MKILLKMDTFTKSSENCTTEILYKSIQVLKNRLTDLCKLRKLSKKRKAYSQLQFVSLVRMILTHITTA